ncbi:MAG: hypothetical protein U0610_00215 [bacterium]
MQVRSRVMGRWALAAVQVLVMALGGCARAPIASDPVTAGNAKRTLVAGQTTQQQVIETFGAPNLVTRTADGTETWTYERVAYDSSWMGGGGGVGAGGIPAAPAVVGGGLGFGGGTSSSGSRTVTLIVYFDATDRVRDYRVMESHY